MVPAIILSAIFCPHAPFAGLVRYDDFDRNRASSIYVASFRPSRFLFRPPVRHLWSPSREEPSSQLLGQCRPSAV